MKLALKEGCQPPGGGTAGEHLGIDVAERHHANTGKPGESHGVVPASPPKADHRDADLVAGFGRMPLLGDLASGGGRRGGADEGARGAHRGDGDEVATTGDGWFLHDPTVSDARGFASIFTGGISDPTARR